MNIFTAIDTGNLSFATYAIITLAAFLSGTVTALAANYRNRASKSFVAALVLLPVIVETIVLMVNGNIGTGIAISGAFSLVRFRSAPGKARDMVLIFLAMTCGVACAAGYIGVALVFALIVSLVLIVIMSIPLKEERTQQLRITIPESLNFTDVFDEVFEKYLSYHEMVSVKTTNMGSLFRLVYRVEMKRGANMKQFMDELRIRNGNLEISLMENTEGNDEL